MGDGVPDAAVRLGNPGGTAQATDQSLLVVIDDSPPEVLLFRSSGGLRGFS